MTKAEQRVREVLDMEMNAHRPVAHRRVGRSRLARALLAMMDEMPKPNSPGVRRVLAQRELADRQISAAVAVMFPEESDEDS